ncbi:hypothetical protein WJX72_012366 [[Myrmecia] bisecta]|uniref:Uncharacterized protein n=1 Tax=[Myrmecia] bisecta TaxID=41462 RepID=A0AAW1Q5D9_9CHLO
MRIAVAHVLPVLCLAALRHTASAGTAWNGEGHPAAAQRSLLQDAAPGSPYIVRLKTTATPQDLDDLCTQLATSGSGCDHKFYTVFLGFAAVMTPDQTSSVTANAKVALVTADNILRLQQAAFAPGPSGQAAAASAAIESAAASLPAGSAKVTIQNSPPWSLDRIDQPNLPLDHRYEYTSDGTGINVYILDTGIRKDHEEFQFAPSMKKEGTRALHGYSVFGDNNSDDCYGHGTHVSGIVGGLTYGVAKNVTLYAVRCISCDGSSQASDVIAALDWLAVNVQFPAVASMSLGSDKPDDNLDAALQAVIDLGVVGVVAAGNYNSDACQLSPGRLPAAITVAATDASDARWASSNYGTCVDLYAPGVQVLSSMYFTTTATITASGTSMACPHVAGVSALYLQNNPTAQPVEVAAWMSGNAVTGVVKGALESADTPNRLLQSDLAATPVITFSPQALSPVVMYEGSFSVTAAQTLTLANAANVSVTFAASAQPNGVIGGWISVTPATGTIPAGGFALIAIKYDFSQNQFQGINTANILITTNARPVAKVIGSTAYVFCSALQTVPQTSVHSVSAINFAVVQDTRPTTSDWPPMADVESYVYATILLGFSHPVGALNASALSINEGAGVIEAVQPGGNQGKMCSQFAVRAKVPFDPWATTSTTLCLTVVGSQVVDVFGNTFPATKNCTTLSHRPVGKLYSAYMASSGDQGLVTSQQNVVLLAVFSKPITGLTTASFTVTGPASGAVALLKPVRGTHSYYHIVINLPAAYYGPVTVSLTGQVLDAAGNKNLPVKPLTFTRVVESLVEGTAYEVLKSPGLLTLN